MLGAPLGHQTLGPRSGHGRGRGGEGGQPGVGVLAAGEVSVPDEVGDASCLFAGNARCRHRLGEQIVQILAGRQDRRRVIERTAPLVAHLVLHVLEGGPPTHT